ncbi:MAG: M13-type metalloendopeptidase [Microbacteriaceae bacterium]|nr:M13-type metalloendopeptidase [Microbacteriaceae bacterium]
MTKSGINTAELDPNVRPQDDLFQHVNGKWIERTEIPADKPSYGAFYVLRENAENAVHDLITGETAPELSEADIADLAKIRTIYSSFMNEAHLEELGATPILADIAHINQISTVTELVETAAQLARGGCGSFFDMEIHNDPGDPTRYVLWLGQGGIGLPDESYYREEQFASVREKYAAHIVRMFELVGLENAAERGARAYELEKRIAASHWDTVACRDIQKVYNLKTAAELRELALEFDWEAYFAEMGQKLPAEVIVAQPDAVAAIAAELTEDNLSEWRAWLIWRLIASSASLLSPEIAQANFDFYGTVLTGVTEQRDRWRRAVAFTEGAMGEAIGRVYVAAHFDPTAKAAMDELVEYLIDAYRLSITELDWMSAETKVRALEKCEKFTPKIGYPVKWRDYHDLQVSDDLFANGRAIAAFELDREFGKLGQPIDRDEWFMTPQTVNAYYNQSMNEIVFPAAILQPPFFDQNADAAANFGAIGGVIGHEIGHGFDDQGSQYNGDGLLNNWWTDSDRAAFEARTSSLIAQYDALSPEGANEGQFVNGKLTIGENIGDLGGLAIAWKAYQLYLNGKESPVIDGLTGAQRFLYAWAQVWQNKIRPSEVQRRLATDPHSPNEFRCNQIVRNLDLFYDAFDVKEGDGLYLPPQERVTIW